MDPELSVPHGSLRLTWRRKSDLFQRVECQSQLRPTRSQATSLGSHSVLMRESFRCTFVTPHFGQGGTGLSDVERYSSKTSSHCSQRYS